MLVRFEQWEKHTAFSAAYIYDRGSLRVASPREVCKEQSPYEPRQIQNQPPEKAKPASPQNLPSKIPRDADRSKRRHSCSELLDTLRVELQTPLPNILHA